MKETRQGTDETGQLISGDSFHFIVWKVLDGSGVTYLWERYVQEEVDWVQSESSLDFMVI